jgi:hypothetical protein
MDTCSPRSTKSWPDGSTTWHAALAWHVRGTNAVPTRFAMHPAIRKRPLTRAFPSGRWWFRTTDLRLVRAIRRKALPARIRKTAGQTTNPSNTVAMDYGLLVRLAWHVRGTRQGSRSGVIAESNLGERETTHRPASAIAASLRTLPPISYTTPFVKHGNHARGIRLRKLGSISPSFAQRRFGSLLPDSDARGVRKASSRSASRPFWQPGPRAKSRSVSTSSGANSTHAASKPSVFRGL